MTIFQLNTIINPLNKWIFWVNNMNIFLERLADKYNDQLGTWAGSGEFGTAYHGQDDIVYKETSDADEAYCAFLLWQQENKDNTSFAKVYSVTELKDGIFGIVMEEISQSGVEDAFSELQFLSEMSGCSIPYLDLDDEEIQQWSSGISDEAREMLNAIYSATLESSQCGFVANDIHSGNIGINQDKRFVLFDQRIGGHEDKYQYIKGKLDCLASKEIASIEDKIQSILEQDIDINDPSFEFSVNIELLKFIEAECTQELFPKMVFYYDAKEHDKDNINCEIHKSFMTTISAFNRDFVLNDEIQLDKNNIIKKTVSICDFDTSEEFFEYIQEIGYAHGYTIQHDLSTDSRYDCSDHQSYDF